MEKPVHQNVDRDTLIEAFYNNMHQHFSEEFVEEMGTAMGSVLFRFWQHQGLLPAQLIMMMMKAVIYPGDASDVQMKAYSVECREMLADLGLDLTPHELASKEVH